MNPRIIVTVLSAAALSIASLAGPALAGTTTYGHAKLAAPLAAPKSANIGGVDWKCEGDACVATVSGPPVSWSTMFACKKVAAEFGALSAYETSGLVMTAGNLAVCNKAAK